MSGRLFLVPNLLGIVPPEAVLPQRTLDVARAIGHWVVETPKAARAFLKTIAVAQPIAELSIVELGKMPDPPAMLLDVLRAGHDVGVLSDAGCPGIADPGARLVAFAHGADVRVVPLVGPSAVLLALMASGMEGQRFAFHGYLPVQADARADALRTLEQRSRAEGRTELFIETPYRNAAMLRTLTTVLRGATRVCVAADLTLDSETIECRTAAQWRAHDPKRLDKRPAMFLLQAS
jgi:16S rRNA (cytidine1402-2'-O)-methyltransferase